MDVYFWSLELNYLGKYFLQTLPCIRHSYKAPLLPWVEKFAFFHWLVPAITESNLRSSLHRAHFKCHILLCVFNFILFYFSLQAWAQSITEITSPLLAMVAFPLENCELLCTESTNTERGCGFAPVPVPPTELKADLWIANVENLRLL